MFWHTLDFPHVIPLMQGNKLIPSASMIKSHFKTHEIVFDTLYPFSVHVVTFAFHYQLMHLLIKNTFTVHISKKHTR